MSTIISYYDKEGRQDLFILVLLLFAHLYSKAARKYAFCCVAVAAVYNVHCAKAESYLLCILLPLRSLLLVVCLLKQSNVFCVERVERQTLHFVLRRLAKE